MRVIAGDMHVLDLGDQCGFLAVLTPGPDHVFDMLLQMLTLAQAHDLVAERADRQK